MTEILYKTLYFQGQETIRKYAEVIVPGLERQILALADELEKAARDRDAALARIELLDLRNAELALALYDIEAHR